jgi:hypothetical protein
VAAERVSGTTGPVIVITSDENEMRAALGVATQPAGDSLEASDQAAQPMTGDVS